MSKSVRMMLFCLLMFSLPLPPVGAVPDGIVLTPLAMLVWTFSHLAQHHADRVPLAIGQVVIYTVLVFALSHYAAKGVARLGRDSHKAAVIAGALTLCLVLALAPIYSDGFATRPSSAYELNAFMLLLVVLAITGGRFG